MTLEKIDGEVHFHKLIISPGHDIPIFAVAKDEDGNKHQFKFQYRDPTADEYDIGTLSPIRAHKTERQDLVQVCADGINKFTDFTVDM